MMKVRHIVILTLVLLAGVLLSMRFFIALSASVQSQRTGACLALDPQPLQGPAPEFKLIDLDGKMRSLADYRGKVVLLNFWATWCPPCVEELPSIARLQAAMQGNPGFALLTVSVDDSAQDVKKLFEQHGKLFDAIDVLMDPSRKVPASFGTEKFPETYLIDPSGGLRYRFINRRDWSSDAAAACLQAYLPRQ